MDDSRRTFIITGFIVVIVLAIIFIGIFYLIRSFQNRASTKSTANGIFPTATTSPLPSGNPNFPNAAATQGGNTFRSSSASTTNTTTTPRTAPADPNSKVYSTDNFQLTYPKGWGLLTCVNSKNIELDPNSGTDNKDVACNYAVKPVTIIVGQTDPSDCAGETVKIGDYTVVKSKEGTDPEIDYRWCVASSPTLDITHRVSSTGGRATSKVDVSKQIEDMIAKFNLATGGS